MISQKFGFLFLMLIFADPDHTMVNLDFLVESCWGVIHLLWTNLVQETEHWHPGGIREGGRQSLHDMNIVLLQRE
jgi:hypothetical protein